MGRLPLRLLSGHLGAEVGSHEVTLGLICDHQVSSGYCLEGWDNILSDQTLLLLHQWLPPRYHLPRCFLNTLHDIETQLWEEGANTVLQEEVKVLDKLEVLAKNLFSVSRLCTQLGVKERKFVMLQLLLMVLHVLEWTNNNANIFYKTEQCGEQLNPLLAPMGRKCGPNFLTS